MTSHDNVTDIADSILLFHESGGHEGSATECTEAGNAAIARVMDERDQLRDESATLRKQLGNARDAEREYKRIFAEMTRTKALKGQQP